MMFMIIAPADKPWAVWVEVGNYAYMNLKSKAIGNYSWDVTIITGALPSLNR